MLYVFADLEVVTPSYDQFWTVFVNVGLRMGLKHESEGLKSQVYILFSLVTIKREEVLTPDFPFDPLNLLIFPQSLIKLFQINGGIKHLSLNIPLLQPSKILIKNIPRKGTIDIDLIGTKQRHFLNKIDKVAIDLFECIPPPRQQFIRIVTVKDGFYSEQP